MPDHGHGGHLGFMQIKNLPSKVFFPATNLNLLYTSMWLRNHKKQYTSHNNMADYITDRDGNWTNG